MTDAIYTEQTCPKCGEMLQGLNAVQMAMAMHVHLHVKHKDNTDPQVQELPIFEADCAKFCRGKK